MGVLSGGGVSAMIAVLFGLNLFSLADRMVLGAVIEPIKTDLGLSDTQMGLLAGLVFAAVYSTVGLPIARLADRMSRRLVIGVCFVVWSLATAACGLAIGFWTLALARLGVAVGEAGLGPTAQALIGEHVPKERRSGALGVFAMGSAIGTIVGMSGGALIADAYGWRMAFFALGGAGLGLAWAVMFLPDAPPARPEPEVKPQDAQVAGVKVKTPMFQSLRGYPAPMWPLIFAAAAHLFVSYGMTWNTAFFIRSYDLSLQQAGLWVGVIGGASGILGALIGGWLGDRVTRTRGIEALPLLCAYSVTASIPFALATYMSPSVVWSFAAAGVMSVLNGIYQAPTYAALQSMAPEGRRASAAALMIFVQNLIGMGLGPVAVGALSDALTPQLGVHALRWALSGIFLVNIASALLFLSAAKGMRSRLA